MHILPFDKRDGKIWFDGEFVEWASANTHVLAHGLNYGSSVFEGIKIYNCKPFKLKEHLNRLFHSAEVLGLKLEFDLDTLISATLKLIEHNDLNQGYIRPLVWRGPENMLISGLGCKVHIAIAAWESFNQTKVEQLKIGLKLNISKWRKPLANSSPFTTKASCIYTLATIIKNEAQSMNFDDSIILDNEGFITETSTSNFFAIINNELHTPLPDCFLNGITRQTIISIANQHNIKVVERKIKLDDLSLADAAFLCGTAIEIMPIASILSYHFNIKHELILKISQLYNELVHD